MESGYRVTVSNKPVEVTRPNEGGLETGAAMSAVVEVNECHVFAVSGAPAEYWAAYRARYEPVDRINILVASIGGDRVQVACDDRDHADWLANHLVEHGSLPKSAVKVKTLRRADRKADKR